MAWNVNDLQEQMAVELDRSVDSPDVGSSDWEARLAVLNRANRDWAETSEWSQTLKVFNGLISTATANASLALPADFRKMDSLMKVGGNTDEFPVVHPSDNSRYLETDNFVNILGGDGGYVAFIHTNNLSSGASIQYTYYSQVTSLTTTTSTSLCPDPTFLVQRALYYIYKSKEDGRFPEAKAESDRILARMLENENSLGRAYVNRSIQVPTTNGFRIGRD